MSKFHVYHISFFDSLLSGLKSNGVSIENLSRGSYIKRFDLSNPNTYLPLQVAYQFIDEVKRKVGVDCIPAEFYGGFKLSELEEYGKFLMTCPDLYSVLVNGMKYETLILTNGKMSLRTMGAISSYSMIHFDKPSAGRQVSEHINLTMMLKAFQFVLGPNWSPEAIRITGDDGYWLKKILPGAHFKINSKSSEIAILFKTSDLIRKNKFHKELTPPQMEDLTKPEAIVHKMLNSMVNGYTPTVEEISGFLGYSRRTVIRSLSETGTSYKEILEKHLFSHALKLLDDDSLSVEDISMILGYSNASNFIRAFRRWSSTTPLQYRKQKVEL